MKINLNTPNRTKNTPNEWEMIGGPGKMFTIDTYGDIYGVPPNGDGIWKYSGNPMGWDKITGNVRVKEVYTGGAHVCALSTGGELWCYEN